MKIIALAAAAVLLAGPAFAQNASFLIITNGLPTGNTSTVISSFTNNVIDNYQGASTGIPAGTNADINGFQQTFTSGAAAINASNPAPNVTVPFPVGFHITVPLAK